MVPLKLVQGGKGKRKRFSRATVGAWVYTPGMGKARLRTIHSRVKLLERRIMAPGSGADDKMRSEFVAFYKEWLRYRQSRLHWTDRVWGSVWDELLAYTKRTNAWLRRAARLGLVTPSTEQIPKEQPGWSQAAKWIAIAVGLLTLRKLL